MKIVLLICTCVQKQKRVLLYVLQIFVKTYVVLNKTGLLTFVKKMFNGNRNSGQTIVNKKPERKPQTETWHRQSGKLQFETNNRK